MSEDILIELCADNECDLIVANHGSSQHRMSLPPDEALKDDLVDIDPSFIKGINAVGIDNIARDFAAKQLPPILKYKIKMDKLHKMK